MKVSKKPTKWIAIKANTTSEWDSCDLVLLNITENYKEYLKKGLEAVELLNYNHSDISLMSISLWSEPDGWYICDNDKINDILYKKGWVYVNIKDDKNINLNKPEQVIDAVTLDISKFGTINFRGYGKHTSEEFFTNQIDLKEILK